MGLEGCGVRVSVIGRHPASVCEFGAEKEREMNREAENGDKEREGVN